MGEYRRDPRFCWFQGSRKIFYAPQIMGSLFMPSTTELLITSDSPPDTSHCPASGRACLLVLVIWMAAGTGTLLRRWLLLLLLHITGRIFLKGPLATGSTE